MEQGDDVSMVTVIERVTTPAERLAAATARFRELSAEFARRNEAILRELESLSATTRYHVPMAVDDEMDFDATLGFPGEGPPRVPVKPKFKNLTPQDVEDGWRLQGRPRRVYELLEMLAARDLRYRWRRRRHAKVEVETKTEREAEDAGPHVKALRERVMPKDALRRERRRAEKAAKKQAREMSNRQRKREEKARKNKGQPRKGKKRREPDLFDATMGFEGEGPYTGFAFDSTMGFPGEGPPKPWKAGKSTSALTCFICEKSGHKADTCPAKKGRGKDVLRATPRGQGDEDADEELKEAKSQQSSIVCALCRSNMHATADCLESLNAQVAAAEKAAKLREKDEAAQLVERKEKAEKQKVILEDMFAKACTLMTVKNMSSKAERTVVMEALAAKARSQELHKSSDVVGDLVLQTYTRAYDWAVERKTEWLAKLASVTCDMTWRDLAREDIVYEEDFVAGFGNKLPADILETLDATRPKSVVKTSRVWWRCHLVVRFIIWVLTWISMVIVPPIEEVVKRAGRSYARYYLGHGPQLANYEVSRVVVVAFNYFMRYVAKDEFQLPVAPLMRHVPWSVDVINEADTGEWAVPKAYNDLLRLLVYVAVPVILAAIETGRQRCATKSERVFVLVIRSCAHILLGMPSLAVGVVSHWAVNIILSQLDPGWMLNTVSLSLSFDCPSTEDVCCDEYGVKPVPVQDGFKVVWGEPGCKSAFGARMFWGVSGFKPTVFRNCDHNERISMHGRVGKLLPIHKTVGGIEESLVAWKEVTAELLPLMRDHVKPVRRGMPVQDWINSFPPAKRDMFQKIYKAGCENVPLVAKSFIKKELVLKAACDIGFKDPRFIQGCPPELSLQTGPYLRPYSKRLRDGLRPKVFEPHEVHAGKQFIYTSGMSGEAVGEAMRQSIRCVESMMAADDKIQFIRGDQSRYDLHLGEGAFTTADSVYKEFLPRKVRRRLKRGLSRGVTNRGTRYSVPFEMQSGWPDTATLDSTLSIGMMVKIFGRGGCYIVILCGDDCVVVTSRNTLKSWGGIAGVRAAYERLGMEVDVEVFDDLNDVSFCSSRFYPTAGTYVLMPKTGKMLGKLCWDMVDRPAKDHLPWLRGISQTLLHYGAVDPMLRALGEAMKSECGAGRIIADHQSEYKHILDGSRFPNEHDSLLYYDHHYGLNEEQVVGIIADLRKARIGEFNTNPALRRLVAVDCGAELMA